MKIQMDKLNRRDLENLRFLLTASLETLQEWHEAVSETERAYARKLLEMYNAELDSSIMMQYDDVQDVTKANVVLKGIMKK